MCEVILINRDVSKSYSNSESLTRWFQPRQKTGFSIDDYHMAIGEILAMFYYDGQKCTQENEKYLQ